MKRILFINDYAYAGGVENVLINIINNLDKDKYDITVCTMFKDKNFYVYYPKHVKYISYNYYIINKTRFSFFKRIINKLKWGTLKLFNYIHFNKYFDTIISIKEGESMKFASMLKKAKKKLAWVHVDFNNLHWSKWVFGKSENELKCMAKFDKVICVAESVKESIISTIGDPKNLIVRYNPIDENKIKQKASEDLELNRMSEGVLLVTVGRLVEEKGYDRLLNVCKKLNDNGFDFELWIIGGGEQEGKLLEQKKMQNLKNVKFFGEKTNPYPYLKKADWFVCSSRCEGFSTVLQEAAVLSKPIITTACSGVKELLGENEYGIIVDNSEEGLYYGIKKILEDSNLIKYYTKQIERVKNSICLEERMKRIEDLF